ncbi:hypothetical protein RUE5091_04055 [Ruegeria denitrificans]|uniref:Uncharacterized protein n=1 Tax=Ruegeria denitrificans TaxID=1715692 RepID=A0A0P1IJN1_9RHOB|nr:hypothetical protein RUE5091_04055 [Ruegeria denitrificans]
MHTAVSKCIECQIINSVAQSYWEFAKITGNQQSWVISAMVSLSFVDLLYRVIWIVDMIRSVSARTFKTR